ncbi:MAG: DUF1016 N-terminal domain-containing protein [Gammaproteobacteria bacterium]
MSRDSNGTLLDKLEDAETRQWCARKTIEHGWNCDVLAFQIVNHLHQPQGKAITNFDATLSPRNLLYMRSFTAAYPDAQIVKQLVSQLPWGHATTIKRNFEELGI